MDNTKELFDKALSNLDEKIQKYSKSAEEALSLNDMNLQEKAMVAPSLHHGFVNCLFSEKRNLQKLTKYRELEEKKFIEKFGNKNIPRYQTLESIKTDENIMKLDDAIEKQKELIKYLEEICRIMSNFNYNIRNAVDMAKLTN